MMTTKGVSGVEIVEIANAVLSSCLVRVKDAHWARGVFMDHDEVHCVHCSYTECGCVSPGGHEARCIVNKAKKIIEGFLATEEEPRYLMLIDGKRHWLTFRNLGVAYDDSSADVQIGGVVLDLIESVERDITDNERDEIARIAD